MQPVQHLNSDNLFQFSDFLVHTITAGRRSLLAKEMFIRMVYTIPVGIHIF
jgi:hypothetical protein